MSVKVVFYQAQLTALARSEATQRYLGHEAGKVKRSAQAAAPSRTGRLRRKISYHVGVDSISAYADVSTNARNKGFRYGAYWNAIDHYLDNAL